jgi:hypothetical protein
VALGNFEHECLHIFLSEQLSLRDTSSMKNWIERSILRRAANGEEFVGQALEDALFEESLVVGLQVAINNYQVCDEHGNATLPGFCFHVARGCYMNAKRELAQLGLDIDALAAEARSIIKGNEPEVCRLGNNCLEVPRVTGEK